MKCFIAREYGEAEETVSVVYEALSDLQVDILETFSMTSGMEIGASVNALISDSDFVVAIISHSSPNVLFEAGLAVGLNKPVFLLVNEGVALPFDLKNMIYITINKNLKNNLMLPLKHFMGQTHNVGSLSLASVESQKTDVGEEQFFDGLQRIKETGDVRQFQNYVLDFFQHIKAQYTALEVASTSKDSHYDFAVWIDELEGKITNPIVFELKYGRMDQTRIETFAAQAVKSFNKRQAVILLCCNTKDSNLSYTNVYPQIMVANFEMFMHAVFKYGLPKSILLLRNSAAHRMELSV